MMKRDECFRILARHIKDEAVVATYSSAVDWVDVAPRVLNYTSIGAMGLDSSHGLGLALGRPDKRVIVLQGDGSLLMNLGSLVTIAALAPRISSTSSPRTRPTRPTAGSRFRSRKSILPAWRARQAMPRVTIFPISTSSSNKSRTCSNRTGPVFATLHVAAAKAARHTIIRVCTIRRSAKRLKR